MIIYYGTIFSVAFFALIADNYRNEENLIQDNNRIYTFFVTIVATILILVAGLRWRVGTDYGNYMNSYWLRKSTWFESLLEFEEPALGLIAKIGSFIYDDYASMFFLCSLITVGLYTKTISKYTNWFTVSILLYVFIGAWHGSFNGVRQYLAAAVLFAGHRFIFERKFWKYLFVVLIASLCHTTALIMIPVYFIVGRELNYKTIVLIVVGAIAMSLSYDFLFDIMSEIKGSEQEGYDYMQTNVSILRVAVAFAPLALGAVLYKQIRVDKETLFYISMTLMNAAFLFATSGSAYLARVGIYTEIYTVLAIPKILKYFNLKG